MSFWHVLSLKIKYYTAHINSYKTLICLIFFIVLSVVYYKYCNKKRCGPLYIALWVAYLTSVSVITLLGRSFGAVNNSISNLFLTYHLLFINKQYFEAYEIMYNIILFVPMGVLLIQKTDIKHTLVIAFGFSLGIELLQLIFQIGFFEICDLIHNSIGAILGIGVSVLVNAIKCRKSIIIP